MIERIFSFLFDCWCWGDHVEEVKTSAPKQRLGAICRYTGAIVVTFLTWPILVLAAQLQYGSITLLAISTLYVMGGLRVYHNIREGIFGDLIDCLVVAVVGVTFILWIATSVFCYYSEKKMK